MVKEVIDEVVLGIAAKIKEIYKGKENYPIYTDRTEQGEERPCFFIKTLIDERKRETGLQDDYYRDLLNIVVIGYTLDSNTEILHSMIENLYDLEYIKLSDGSQIRAMKLHPKIEDDVLHFFIDYNLFIKKEKEKIIEMDGYQLSEGGKDNESN